MDQRTQTLDRGRLEKGAMNRQIKFEVLRSQRRTFLRYRLISRLMSTIPPAFLPFGGKVVDLYRVKRIMKNEGYHSIK